MITLLSDFGAQDAYVAVMKGVIATIAPNVKTCDLTHEIPPQNILAARFNLTMAYPYFPVGTVHLAVVDPGVGSARLGVAVQFSKGFFVGPNNGLFGGLLPEASLVSAVSLTNPQYWRASRVSQTFHGRDIFAPVAAHLANGVAIEALGDRIDPATLIQPNIVPIAQLRQSPAAYVGSLQYIDRFGNLISNIPAERVPKTPWQVTIEDAIADSPQRPQRPIPGRSTYSDVPTGALVSLAGSHGWIEIACNGGNAAQILSATPGLRVVLESL